MKVYCGKESIAHEAGNAISVCERWQLRIVSPDWKMKRDVGLTRGRWLKS